MKAKARFRVLKSPSRLPALVERPGGLTRPVAIEKAQARAAALRGPAMAALAALVATLDRLAAAPLAADGLVQICRVTDRLIALAEIYDCHGVVAVGKRLCDLAAAFTTAGEIRAEALAVHVRALHLMLLDPPPEGVLPGLDKVLVHFAVRRADSGPDMKPPAAGAGGITSPDL